MILVWLLIVPLIAGPLAFFLRRRPKMELVNVAAFGIELGLAVALAAQVLRGGAASLWEGFLYADALSALVVLLSAFAALVCSIYAVGYFRQEERSGVLQEAEKLGGRFAVDKLREYYTLTPLLVFAIMLVALANNLGILWVAVEGTTLASVFLVMFYGRETSLEAAWKYAIIGGVGLSLALFGTILTYYSAYRALGTDTLAGLNWSALAGNAGQFDKPTMRLAFILILLGYGTKAGIAPMHTWKPEAYSEAPIPGAAMLATGVLNCALYALVRFYILSSKCLGPQFASHLLILFGLLSMGVAVPFILVQKNFRRLLAYSSIDHSGPLTGAAFLMVTLAVTGSPPFSFFQSEFTILRAGFSGGYFVLAIFFISFLVLIFSGYLVHIANLVLGEDSGLPRADTCGWKRHSVAGLTVVIVVMGFWIPAPLFHLIQSAVGIVVGG